MIRLSSQRMILRSWTDADREPFAQMSQDPQVMEHLRPLATRAACDAWIDFQIEHESSHGFCLWAVELGQSNAFVGAVGYCTSAVAHFTRPEMAAHRSRVLGQDRNEAAEQRSLWLSRDPVHRACCSRRLATRDPTASWRVRMVHKALTILIVPEGDPLRRQALFACRETRGSRDSEGRDDRRLQSATVDEDGHHKQIGCDHSRGWSSGPCVRSRHGRAGAQGHGVGKSECRRLRLATPL